MNTHMVQPLAEVENAEGLVAIFGRWPSFHDGTINWLRYVPAGDLELECDIFRMTSEVDNKGFFVCDKHTRVKLTFANCEKVEMVGGFVGAVIGSLEIQCCQLDYFLCQGFLVTVSSVTEFSLRLTCMRIKVAEVESLIPKETIQTQ